MIAPVLSPLPAPFSDGPEGRVSSRHRAATARSSGPSLNGRPLPRPSFVPAYTLVELFLTLAVLMIVLGLMMNLANRVRRDSADRLTRQMLAQLTAMMDQYQKTNNALPPVQPLLQPGLPPGEPALQQLARQNSADFVQYLHISLCPNTTLPGSLTESLDPDPTTGQSIINDPWGSPIVFMPQQNPAIGMAPADAPFFFSAGPDRQYLTREDNVYSYEGSGGGNEE